MAFDGQDILKSSLYEAFAEASDNVYIYVTDMTTGLARWSLKAVEYFDLPGEYMQDPGELWGNRIHPDDREIYFADIEAVFSGKTNRHSCQYRAMNRYGEYVWLECKGTMIYDKDGNMDIFAGMMTRLDSQSRYDPLTGILTKDEFYSYDFVSGSGVVILLGLDDFRKIINIYGYSYGDEILVEFARKLSECCDGAQKAIRFNGDEFMLILPGDGREKGMQIYERLKNECCMIQMKDGRSINLSLSAGADCYPLPDGDENELITRLELAMDYVKRVNKGNMAFYSGEIEAKQNRRITLKKELKKSIANNFEGFELYYQPWIDAGGTSIRGCEALLRWKGEQITNAGPVEFIPILEEDDSIIEVGRWVMKEAMKQQKKWQEQYKDFKVSFNVSYRQFLEVGYVEEVIDTAKEYGVNPNNMVIELTESCDVETPESLAVIFGKLREYGFQIALDDFGTGYSSMELLKKLPADEIKIEHNFVRELERTGHEVDFAIIESIMFLCKKMNCGVVVEGVENQEVDEIVRGMGATYLQGYFYSKPICREDFEKMLEDNAAGVVRTRVVLPGRTLDKKPSNSLDRMLVDALTDSYISLHMLNLNTDTYFEYRADAVTHGILGYTGRITGTFNKALIAIASLDYVKPLLEFVRIDTLHDRLKDRHSLDFDFDSKMSGRCRLSYIPIKYDEDGKLEYVMLAMQKI